MNKFKEEAFIEKFYKKNGEKYKYLGYENGLVKFLCKKHNLVNYDTPSHLLKNRGCKECGKESDCEGTVCEIRFYHFMIIILW